jgi:hypothetical protein
MPLMKTLLFILTFLFFISCNDSVGFDIIHMPPEKSQMIKLKLADSLGSVIITLPQRYDTSFSWTDYSDCGKPCDKVKYRSQPKTLPITMERGFIKPHAAQDSVERFTITHSAEFPFHNGMDSAGIARELRWRKEYVENEMDVKIKSDTVERIGNRYFAILTVDYYDSLSNEYCKKLLATTTIKSNPVFFDFELLTKVKDSLTNNFIENSKYYLRTASIDNGM